MSAMRHKPLIAAGRTATRALVGIVVALLAMPGDAVAQNEGMLRNALEGKTVVVRIDMPATSRGVEVYPLDAAPLNFRELAQRIKDNGTAIRIGQQVMVTKVVVKKDSHIEFQLGGGGYGTFGDSFNDGSNVSSVAAGETKAEKMLRDSIKAAPGPTSRKRFERELESLRSERQRENARAAAEAEQARAARETFLRVKRLDAGSRFNVRFRSGIPAEVLTPDGLMRALAAYVEFPGAPANAAVSPVSPAGPPASGLSALKKGLSLTEVEALLGPATTANEVKEGSLTVLKRTYKHEGMKVAASFVGGVLIDFAITPQ